MVLLIVNNKRVGLVVKMLYYFLLESILMYAYGKKKGVAPFQGKLKV